MKSVNFVWWLLMVLNFVSCAKILAVFHVPVYSHYTLGIRLLRPLAEKGHEITLISPFRLPNPPQNWNEIVLEDFGLEFTTGGKQIYKLGELSSFQKEMSYQLIGYNFAKDLLEHPKFKSLLNSNKNFDLIILERFVNEALLGLSHHFKAPHIWSSTLGYTRWINGLAGNPGSPAYTPDLYLDYPTKMSYWQRCYNTLLYFFVQLHTNFVVLPKQQKLLEKHFPTAPRLEELYYNSSLILVNSHSSIRRPVPSVPNMIEIGGYHVNPPKRLSKDLEEYMNNAKGVIYFSLGSAVKSKDMPDEIRDSILRTFSKLKENVIWKWEENSTFVLPPNVKLGKWFQQQDILAHPNLKLFITHGGLLSTIEAVYHGVPLLALPVFAEQSMNAAEMEALGYGLQLPFSCFCEDKFYYLIKDALNNPRYKENMKVRSKIFHDQEMKPIDKAIFWIEYVIRHRGAPHLKSITLDLTWYQLLLLDVIAGCIAILFLIFVIIKFCIKITFRKIIIKKKIE